ncbi:hypothetical protein [Mesorhizobium sp.]|uniref:hypothetical protein n=1 Tax=Mesorhizobium sp. TaxID=1871066 RepID=UPI00257BB400|nr:hypothetical protein [Mesorhizobium sp.]
MVFGQAVQGRHQIGMQQRARQRRHRLVGRHERVCAFEHRLLQQGAGRRIIPAEQLAQISPEPFVREPGLGNDRLGGASFHFAENVKGCHVTQSRKIS